MDAIVTVYLLTALQLVFFGLVYAPVISFIEGWRNWRTLQCVLAGVHAVFWVLTWIALDIQLFSGGIHV